MLQKGAVMEPVLWSNMRHKGCLPSADMADIGEPERRTRPRVAFQTLTIGTKQHFEFNMERNWEPVEFSDE